MPHAMRAQLIVVSAGLIVAGVSSTTVSAQGARAAVATLGAQKPRVVQASITGGRVTGLVRDDHGVAVPGAAISAVGTIVTVAYTDAGELKIQRIDATGGVHVTRGNESARGDVAIYDFNRRIITLVGNVALNRGGDTLNGGRLVIDLASGIASVDGRAGGGSSAVGSPVGSSKGGRVSGTFSVPKSGN